MVRPTTRVFTTAHTEAHSHFAQAQVRQLEQQRRAAATEQARHTPSGHQHALARHMDSAGLRHSDEAAPHADQSQPATHAQQQQQQHAPALTPLSAAHLSGVPRGSPTAGLRENVQRVLQLDEVGAGGAPRARAPLPQPHIVASSHPSSPALFDGGVSAGWPERARPPPSASPSASAASAPAVSAAAAAPYASYNSLLRAQPSTNHSVPASTAADGELKRMLESQQRDLHQLHHDVAALRSLIASPPAAAPSPASAGAAGSPMFSRTSPAAAAAAPSSAPAASAHAPPRPADGGAATFGLDQLLAHNDRLAASMVDRYTRSSPNNNAPPARQEAAHAHAQAGALDDISLELLRQIERTRAALASSHVNVEDERRRFLAAAPVSLRAAHVL